MNKISEFLRKNIILILFILFSFLFEILEICSIGGNPCMTKPLYYLLILGLIVGSLYLFKNNIVRIVITSTVLLLQIVSNVGFIYLYDSNGTFFEWAMMNQRDDAFGTIEDLSLKWGLLALLCVLLVV